MTRTRIDNAVVIGAGTMGAALAAHFANAGITTTLLDIVPRQLDPKEEAKGLSLTDTAVRNRIVNEGWQRCVKARPANLFSAEVADRVSLGNLEDDFDVIADADWVLEAIVERLDIKQQLMERIDKIRKLDSIISTNTSGIPIHQIAEGRSKSFQENFLGTHFFNPPRYLKLLELIPHEKNSPELIEFMSDFCNKALGKGVVICKDTPNFIANRIFSISTSFSMNYALDNAYAVEEVDVITGPSIGRPKTGTFRLNDLVGIDLGAQVSTNLYEAIPHDVYRETLKNPKTVELVSKMVEKGWLGNKTGQGYYKKTMVDGVREFWILNPETFEYEAPQKPRFDSIGAAREITDMGERLKMLAYAEDRVGEFVWHILSRTSVYAASVIPEISDDILSVDNACRWGFVWELGPFEIWDAIGLRKSIERLKSEEIRIPAWVDEMLEKGYETFYQRENGRVVGYYDIEQGEYEPIPVDPNVISVTDLRAQGKELYSNDSAGLLDMGDGILLLEFHNAATANALDEDIFAMSNTALEQLEKDEWKAMVIGNQGKHFSAGANIFMMAISAQQGDFDVVETASRGMHSLMQRMSYSPKPIVAAPFGMTLAGGCEVALAASRIVASAETYIGLVEAGVGLVPGGGGIKETIRRVINPVMKTKNADVLPHMQKAFEQIAMGKVAESAMQGREMGYLSPQDKIVMNQDHLLAEAKQEALNMVAEGYRSPAPRKVWAAGRDVFADLKLLVWSMIDTNWASEHDGVVSNWVAYVLTGGDLSEPGWVPDQYILDLEREAFMALLHEEKTIERMWHMLQKKKPLRN
ncbi:MAG: 3-hydroxyacyl-CoA dehydrogenase/enoyl-CoA hydratase family protein [Anaerolineales bacterium]|nr:3-hydroxyacyl-CoA dehydrogenase/enoyl-CoA hydratase family protein [Anaerolineales bacterium]